MFSSLRVAQIDFYSIWLESSRVVMAPLKVSNEFGNKKGRLVLHLAFFLGAYYSC